MQTLIPTLTPSWRGVLVSTTDEQVARRLQKRMSIKTIVRGCAARFREEHDGRHASLVITCRGNLYELEAA